ncbi:non-ribosomal peptide synthetase [Streptomyces sp. NPDC051104]|uniref:non-ribosomal peptide synthetase n=1 Tax=Streptomyces sp. NPDC051104 TaxID=3155044 RepID=UPI003437B2D2
MQPNDRRPTLDQRLSALAATHPDRVVAVDDTRSLTLRQLDGEVDALAERIRDVAAPGSRVAVLVARGVDAVAAPYAVWRAGCVYVPVDLAWPQNRIGRVLQTAADAVVEEQDGSLTVTARRSAEGREGDPGEVAYIIHTSGSTGAPKGVQISHDALNALVDNHQRLIYQPEGVLDGPVAMVASTAFDSSIERLALAAHGYAVHVLGDAVRSSPERLIAYLAEHRIVNADFVPSHLRVLIEAGLLTRATALRLLIVGGERFDAELWETVAASDVSAYNVYGPTENTVNTSITKVVAGDRPNIGRPLPGVDCAIVDAEGHPVPDGEEGELVIGGAQLSLGYLGEPELTARAFRELDGRRCYWTGDLMRRAVDTDALEFVGRVDDQVKINGYRIEPEEILHSLRHLPGVHEAAVTPVETGTGHKLLASVVPSDAATPPDAEALRAQLADALPDYMVPAHWMVVPELPLTTNFKRDHEALRALWRSRSAGEPAAEASAAATAGPADDPEEVVRQVFGEVLNVEVTDPATHFFAVGGDSLAVMRLIVLLRTRTGVELELADVIKNPTIGKLAVLLAARSSAGVAGHER